MAVLARIQGHPSRAHLHQPLAEKIDLPTEVMLHASDPPNPWEGYKTCLRDIPECSHLLVIQDDARPALNFASALERIAERHPDIPVVLFLARLPHRIFGLALREKTPYFRTGFRVNEFCPVVAILWPKHKAQEFLAWTEQNHRRLPRDKHNVARSDDGVMGRWCHYGGQEVVFTVPSIVQHDDEEASLIGRKAMWGRDRARTTALFVEDASVVSW